jgi:hypothetical protein
MFYFVRYVSSVAEGGAIFCKWAEGEVRTSVGHKKVRGLPLRGANILHPRSSAAADETWGTRRRRQSAFGRVVYGRDFFGLSGCGKRYRWKKKFPQGLNRLRKKG